MNDTQHFRAYEFDCPCCHKNEMKQSFVDWLELIRADYGRAMVISSGYRCAARNAVVNGHVRSAHLDGCGCDVLVNTSADRHALVALAIKYGAKGIGIYPSHVHIDTKKRQTRVMWHA